MRADLIATALGWKADLTFGDLRVPFAVSVRNWSVTVELNPAGREIYIEIEIAHHELRLNVREATCEGMQTTRTVLHTFNP